MTPERDLRALPKVELHVHLEGTVRPATARELLKRSGQEDPPQLRGGEWRFRDFPDFIDGFTRFVACLREPEDFRRIAYEYGEDLHAQGCTYAEVTFSIAQHAPRLGDWDAPVEWVRDGFERAERDLGVRCRLVLDVVRDLPLDHAAPTLHTALRHREAVVALGLGGDEASFENQRFAEVFAAARDAELPTVPHAGEAAGPESVRSALEHLHATRIGHGIRAGEELALLEELVARGVTLEVCPTSNAFTGVVEAIDRHPLPDLVAAGVPVTLGSDDPPMFATSLLHEYELARRVFGFDDQTLADIARAGVAASFLPDADKADLRAAIGSWLGDDPARAADHPARVADHPA